MPHVRPSRPPGATASHGARSPERGASTQVPEEEGVELRRTADGKGDGVMATRPFAVGETVMVGFLVGGLTGNDSHATQVGPGRWALHGGLGPKVNHSCDPNCGVRLNDVQAFDFVARGSIAAGQELTFDYAMRNFTIDHFPVVCLCGA
ncbi:MAG TPA: SET domain-containing methyltransferase, partial [Solirubrobacteraceae bacterium]